MPGEYGPMLQVRMIDRDTMEELSEALNASVKRVHPPSWQKRGWQPQYQIRISGKKVRAFLERIAPQMSKRRQEQISRACGIRTHAA